MNSQSSHPLPQPSNEEPARSVELEVNAIQAAVEDVTQNYLETLDALSTVYDVAAGFAQLFDTSSIASFTLRRILESLDVGSGAIFLESGGELKFYVDSEGAREHLREDAVEDASLDGRALFCNGSDAIRYLRSGTDCRNVLLAPVVAAQRCLGIVAVTAEDERRFTTKDLKLVSAVTSQAAIALSGAQHLEQILVERQKLRSIIEDNGGGIVVLAPDGRTMLTNTVARELLGFAEDRAEGFSLIEELAAWKSSRDPECLRGDGPPELSLELAEGPGSKERVVSMVGRRVRGTDGELASIVLNLQDATEQRRDERMKEDVLSLISKAFRLPIETMRETLGNSAEGTGAGEQCSGCMNAHVEELEQLADRLRCYTEVLDDSWTGFGRADLGEVVAESSSRMIASHADRSPNVEVQLDPSATQVGISRECAHIITDNLLDYAIEHSRDSQPGIRVSSSRLSPGWIALELEDRGAGLPAEIQQEFIRALDRDRDDLSVEEAELGIRLALVEEAVRRCGGKVEARPAPDGGTLLTITLPAA